jgi:hypothetical protein
VLRAIARKIGHIVNITSGSVKSPIPELGMSNGGRAALASVLKSGLVVPLNGAGVFAALDARGCGLLDPLIADDYRRAELTTLTLDHKMGALPQVCRL